MIAAQMLAAHNAAMECYRRAMFGEPTFEGRRENLSQANKLSWTYAVLLDALNRHRGKGQQTVRVEHVTVQAGGQAIVGHVETPGGGDPPNSKEQPHAIAFALGTEMPRPNPERYPCQTSAMPNGRCGIHGGMSPGAPKANKNAFRRFHKTAQRTLLGNIEAALSFADRDFLGELLREIGLEVERALRSALGVAGLARLEFRVLRRPFISDPRIAVVSHLPAPRTPRPP